MNVEIWTEKYRPKKLDEVINQSHVVERLRSWVKEGSIPNMLFAGRAGVGKTTMALCLAREIYGEQWQHNFQETNASVTPDTPIIIKESGKLRRTNFGYLDKYFKDGEKYAKVKDLKILSIGKNNKPKFSKVSLISRHKVDKIAEIMYEGGKINTSLNHSVIVMDNKGNLVSKEAKQMESGDLLITFCDSMDLGNAELDFSKHSPKETVNFKSSSFLNPKIKTVIGDMSLNEELSWLFGMYLAEGCAHIKKKSDTNGCVIFTLSSEEGKKANRIKEIMDAEFGLKSSIKPASSGFDRSRMSSLQVRSYNTQLARFFLENFYDGAVVKNAISKRVPPFVFASGIDCKKAFMMGYTGDVYGEWEKCLRYSSRSTENLIDVAWLGRMTGIDTSVFRDEVRALWKLPSYSYIKTELMPSGPIAELIKELNIKDGNNYRYLLRHQFYSKKSKRVSKRLATEILKKLSENVKDNRIKNFLKFAESPLSSIRIKSIEMKDYEGYVYDVSVPKSEMFWGGTTPILLHNSDERGINVVRGRIKDFAKMKPLGADFKIIFLDESDALTPEAQQALRRTMEKFSGACRFILSCNYSSRIIEPIQSRCAVFRFKGLTEEHVIEYVRRIVKGEKLQADEEGLKAIFNISEGDLRKATNILQAAAAMGKITKDNIYDIAMQANPRDVKDMLNLAVDGKFAKARGKLYELLINQGLSGEDIIKEMHRQVYDLDIDEIRKFGMIEKLGEFEFRLNQGGSEDIQLEALLANFAALKK